MLAISVELLHGTIRAGSPDDTVLAGDVPVGEWPPSPARLFSALVAGDGTRGRSAMTTGAELHWLESLSPPLIYADPPDKVEETPLKSRFVVEDGTCPGAVQNYPARTAKKVRPGSRQSPATPRLIYVWPDAEPSPAHLLGLRARAARIGYLGCADSPVRLRVGEKHRLPVSEPWSPDVTVRASLPVPYPGFTDVLDDAFDRWTAGVPVRRSWVRTVRSGYRAPGASQSLRSVRHRQVLWLRFDETVVGRMLVPVTETLRKAVIDHVQRLLPPGGRVPAFLHGHRHPGDGPEQVCFLALPDVGQRYAQGRIFGAALLLPTNTEGAMFQTIQSALGRLASERLVKPGWFDLGVSIHGGEKRPWACHPQRWSNPACRWVTATPVVYERWTKGVADLAEVARWCRHAGLPDPVAAGLERRPRIAGGLDLHPAQVARPGRQRRPYSHMWVEFAEPVGGPVVLGRGRYLGLGLMAPWLSGGPGGRDD